MPQRKLIAAKSTATSVCKQANALAKQLWKTRDAVRIHMRAAEEAEVAILPVSVLSVICEDPLPSLRSISLTSRLISQ